MPRCRRKTRASCRGAKRRKRCSGPIPASTAGCRTSPRGSSTGDWIDAPVRRGKTPGAFAHPTVPSVHPYVLLNYQGKTRDVMTLAHELGHGVHQVLAAAQGPLLSRTPLTLAETASVFGEMLTFQSVLRDTADARRAQGTAGPEGRGHAQHGGAPDRVLYVRAQGAHGTQIGRTHGRAAGRTVARGARRKPRTGEFVWDRDTKPSGATSRTSSIRRSTSTPTPSATVW